MQFQADVLGVPIERCAVLHTTALGAGYLAGLAVGFWSGLEEIETHWRSDARFEPSMKDVERERLYGEWKQAVERVKDSAR